MEYDVLAYKEFRFEYSKKKEIKSFKKHENNANPIRTKALKTSFGFWV